VSVQRRRSTRAGLVLALVILVAACGGPGRERIDQNALSRKIRSTTSLDTTQADCVARQVLRRFIPKEVETLCTKGLGPLRYSQPGQLYVMILVGCSGA